MLIYSDCIAHFPHKVRTVLAKGLTRDMTRVCRSDNQDDDDSRQS